MRNFNIPKSARLPLYIDIVWQSKFVDGFTVYLSTSRFIAIGVGIIKGARIYHSSFILGANLLDQFILYDSRIAILHFDSRRFDTFNLQIELPIQRVVRILIWLQASICHSPYQAIFQYLETTLVDSLVIVYLFWRNW